MFLELPKCPTLDALDTEPETVLECRLVKKGNSVVPQVLIKWTGLPADRATWEDWEVLKTRFPSVLAWGQASASPGGHCHDGSCDTLGMSWRQAQSVCVCA
jgi:hypothetical protein